jgi:2Fe-2S ferredoxin
LPKVTYIEHGGIEHQVDLPDGLSVMQGAKNNSIRGIDGDCGGALACATCHVYVDHKWLPALCAPEQTELDMLSMVEDVRDNSRLSCQICASERTDGIIVRLPISQF